ncbi:MAG: hypothetical protein AMXMBFR4_06930 [Candidatus Hydrogenedentota bacterium]
MTSVHLKTDTPTATVNLILRVSGPLAGRVVDETDRPVVGARIVPIAHDHEDVSRTARPFDLQTGSDGAFRVDMLPERSWTLRIISSDFAPLDTPPIDVGDVDNVFVLSKGGAIAGRVVSEDERPVSRCNIVAINLGNERSAPSHETTDNLGAFRFECLPVGKHALALEDPRLVLLEHPVITDVELGTTQEVVLTAVIGPAIVGTVYDKSAGVEIKDAIITAFQPELRALPVRREITDEFGEYTMAGMAFGEWQLSARSTSSALVPWHEASRTIVVQRGIDRVTVDFELNVGVAVSGSVTHADGTPALGARVVARGRALRETSAKDDGTFQLTGFEPGETLTISAETPTLLGALAHPVTVTDSGLKGIQIVLASARNSSISGTVTDRSLRPLVMYVVARPRDTVVSSADVAPMAMSDSAGRFALVGLTAGSYELRLAPSDPEGFVRPVGQTKLIEIGENQRLQGVRLVYEEGEFLSIAGRVTDTLGNPIARATIRVSCPDRRGRSTKSDDYGEYIVRDIPEGLCRVDATHPEFSSESLIDIPAGSMDVVIRMAAPASVSGLVISDRDRKPVPQFGIGVARASNPENPNLSDPPFQMFSDPEGRFRLKVEPGPNVLFVRSEGFLPVRLALGEIQAGQKVENVLVQLAHGRTTVTGVVVDASGNPVPNASIFLGPASRQLPPSASLARSAEDGTFVLHGLSPGPVTLTAWEPRYGRGSISVTVQNDAETVATLVLSSEGSLSGNVSRAGLGVSGARITLLDPESGDVIASTVTDASGFYELDLLIPGNINVVARTDVPEQELRAPAVIRPGTMAHLDLVME